MKTWTMAGILLAAGLAARAAQGAAPAYAADAAFVRQLEEGAARILAPDAAPLSKATAALRDDTNRLVRALSALVRTIMNGGRPGGDLSAFLRAQEAYKSDVLAARRAAEQCADRELGGRYAAKLGAYDSEVGNFVSMVIDYVRQAEDGRWESTDEKVRKAVALWAQASSVNALCAELFELAQAPAAGDGV